MADKFYENLEAIVGPENMAKVNKKSIVDWSKVSRNVFKMAVEETIVNVSESTFVPEDRINRDALLAGMQYTPHNAAGHPGPSYDAHSYGICFGKNLHMECEEDYTPLSYSYSIYTMARGKELHWYAKMWDTASAANQVELTLTAEADMKARNAAGEPDDTQLTDLIRVDDDQMISLYFPQNGVGQRLLVLTTDGDRIPLPVYLERFPIVLHLLNEIGLSTRPRLAFSRCLHNPGTWTDYQTVGHLKETLRGMNKNIAAVQIMINAAADYYKNQNIVIALRGFH